MPTGSGDQPQREEIKRLLDQARVIQNGCDLDLLVFLHRHPRTLLTSEQVAGFVGYSIKQIAEALEAFIEAGLLERTSQQATHAARMFLLQLDGPQGGGISALVELASSRRGRQSILEAFNGPGRRGHAGSPPELRLIKAA